MAKTIKFNLICDEKPIRTIDDLQNNFSIEDVLEYYNNKLLHRWLQVRGYHTELEAVSAIDGDEPMEIIKELIRIFNVAADEKDVEEKVYILKYLVERKELCAIYEKEEYKVSSIVDDYIAGYNELVNGIYDNPNDCALIKANIAEMASKYTWALDLNHRDLFWGLWDKSEVAIMCLLMNENTRCYYLPVVISDEEGAKLDTELNEDKKQMFNKICWMIRQNDFAEKLSGNLMVFSGMTDGYWKDLQPKGKKYMIVSMGDGDYVRSAGCSGGDLSSADVLNKFIIVDGIDYKSNSDTRELRYMEV